MENLALTVGKNLSALRKAKGLTQQELAQQINYSDKSLSKWELGYALPSVDVMLDIAHFYGVTIDYLTQEHLPEAIEQQIAEDKKQDVNASNKAVILAMTLTFVLLVAMSIFFSSYFIHEGKDLPVGIWSVYVWMIPIMCFLSAWEVRWFYHNRVAFWVLASSFLWSLLLAFCFYFQFFRVPSENVWFILVVGIPIQIILVLLAKYKRV